MTSRTQITEQLLDYLQGRLPDAQRAVVERLLANSPIARSRMAWLQEFHRQAARTRVEAPPAELRERLMADFSAHRRVHRAEVLHDSRRVTEGVRSVGVAERWAVIHASDIADIAVDFARSGDMVSVSGQILPLGDRHVRVVELLAASQTMTATPADEYGQFTCGSVAPGSYRLLIDLDGETVSVDVDIEHGEEVIG